MPHADVRVGVLGPLSVHVGGELVEITAPAQRTLLGLLAIRAGAVVSADDIADQLWLGHPPAVWRNQIRVHINRLLALLEPGREARVRSRTIVWSGRGYRLVVGGDRLDVAHFDDLANRAAAAADPAAAEELYAQGLACWRGQVLANLGEALRSHPDAVAVSRRRVSATLAYAQLAVAAGHHAEAKRWLTEIADQEPLHEALHALLITALAGSGEQAAAVTHYAEIRDRLIDELGIDPGPQIESAYRQMLQGGRAEADMAVVPMQLPAATSDFVGREAPMAQLDEWAAAGVPVIAITGGAGVGKTALAGHWAYRAAAGRDVLYLNLRGYGDEPPVTTIEALSYFLRSLGLAPQSVPLDPDAAGALYRSVLAGRRTLVVLDNANGPDQIRPLLPGGAGNLVVVTSRDRLSGLMARDGARRLALTVLTEEHANDLLIRLLGAHAVAAEPEAAADLARACAFLPLALRIAAANITDERYRSIAELSAALDVDGWPDPLEIDGDVQARVRIAFEHSYAGMARPVQRLFRLAGLVPGPDFTTDVARSLAGEPDATVPRDLRALVDAHLLDQVEPGRYAFHDLLRRYAAVLGATVDDPADRTAATTRLCAYYLDRADGAARAVYPQMLRLPNGRGNHDFADKGSALDWLDAERANLIATIRRSVADGDGATACALSDALRGYFSIRRHMPEWLAVARLVTEVAAAAGDDFGEVSGRISLSQALWWLSRRGEAIDALLPAVRIAERIGWGDGLAATHGNLGALYGQWGRLPEAVEHLRTALDLNERSDSPVLTRANMLTNMGEVLQEMGRVREAVSYHHQSIALYEKMDAGVSVAYALSNLGNALIDLGESRDAAAHLESAHEVFEEVGERFGEAVTLADLAQVRLADGAPAVARELAERALVLAREVAEDRSIARSLNVLGAITGDPARHTEALAYAAGTHYVEVLVLLGRAQTLYQLDRFDEALADGQRALASARRLGFRALEGDALARLAEVHCRAGRRDRAAAYATEARGILRECGRQPATDRNERILALLGTVVDDGG